MYISYIREGILINDVIHMLIHIHRQLMFSILVKLLAGYEKQLYFILSENTKYQQNIYNFFG